MSTPSCIMCSNLPARELPEPEIQDGVEITHRCETCGAGFDRSGKRVERAPLFPKRAPDSHFRKPRSRRRIKRGHVPPQQYFSA